MKSIYGCEVYILVMSLKSSNSEPSRRLVWQLDERSRINYSAMPTGSIGALRTLSDSMQAGTMSRACGLVLEHFVFPDDPVTDVERRIDERLDDEHNLRVPQSHLSTIIPRSSLSWVDDLADEDLDWIDSDTARYQASIPTELKDEWDDSYKELNAWGTNNNATVLAILIREYHRSPFTDRLERMKTKQQILDTLEGDRPARSKQTSAFERIAKGSFPEWAEMKNAIEDHPAIISVGDDASVKIDTRDIDVDDDVEIKFEDAINSGVAHNPIVGESPAKHPLKKTADHRAGLTMAVLRSDARTVSEEFDVFPGASETRAMSRIEIINYDYDRPDQIWRKAIEPECEIIEYEGKKRVFPPGTSPPTYMIIDARNRRRAMAKALNHIVKTPACTRDIPAGMRDVGIDVDHRQMATRGPNNEVTGLLDLNNAAAVLDTSELERTAKYVFAHVNKDFSELTREKMDEIDA